MQSLILLAGCGLGDGSCIEEVILTYLALEKYKCPYQATALNIQATSVNHISEEPEDKRNVLIESARIGRGKIKDLNCINIDDFDCLIIPGGIGLLANYRNQDAIQKLILSFVENKKPIATMCAGIDFLRNLLGKDLLREECESLLPDSFCCDPAQKIYYTPAFTKAENMCDVKNGIDRMICKLNSMN